MADKKPYIKRPLTANNTLCIGCLIFNSQ